jgi:6-phosphogluconolactonase
MKAVLSLMTDFREFGNFDDLAENLAGQIGGRLNDAINARGCASLAVSGGSTPLVVYERLSQIPLDWEKVTLVLVDDRWVDPGLKGSNEGAVLQALRRGPAARARFVGLKTPHATPRDATDSINERLRTVPLPFDVVVLGMGPDGHTASWFPRAEGLTEALARQAPLAVAVTAKRSEVTGPFTERMTLTLRALKGARFTVMLLKGKKKRSAWTRALGPGPVEDMPVRALLNEPSIDPVVFWAPDDGDAR